MTLQSGSKITLGDVRTEMAVTASPFTLGSAQGDIYTRINVVGSKTDMDVNPNKLSEFYGYNHTSASGGCGDLYDGMILGTWNLIGTNNKFLARRFNNQWWFVQETYGEPGTNALYRKESGSYDAFLGRGAEMMLRNDFTLQSASYGTYIPCFAWISSSFGGLVAPDTGTLPPPKYYQYVYDAAADFWQHTAINSLPATGSIETISTDSQYVKYLAGVTGSYSFSVDLSSNYGDVTFTYDAGEQPDRFLVQYNGSTIINTKYRGNPIHNKALYRRGFLPVTGSIDGKGSITFQKLSTASAATIIVNSPIGNTDFGFSISSPIKPAQQTINVYMSVSGSVGPLFTNPTVYYSIANDAYANVTSAYLSGSSVTGSGYANMGTITLSSGSALSIYPTNVTGSAISYCNTQNCGSGSFQCGATTYNISSSFNVYLTAELDSSGNFVACNNGFGPGIYYTLYGI